MEILYHHQDLLLQQVNDAFFRYLADRINWRQRMLAIKGPRGSGKTTMMLQYIKYRLNKKKEQALYITADHHWFYAHTLVDTASVFYKNGGRYLFIDEVHKYPNWSRELKNIYDGYPALRVVFSSSSALDIYRGESDLSRRVITYELPGLSFREFLSISGYGDLPAFSLEQLITTQSQAIEIIRRKIERPLPLFKKYLRYGYLPIFQDGVPEEVPFRLNQTINTVIETDLANIQEYTPGTAYKIKKLLGVLAESVPFKPNISAIARKLDASRESVYAWLVYLEKARLLNLLTVEGKGISLLQKPEKIYLENTNLAYALKALPDIGSIRETFLLNQLTNVKLDITLPDEGDFHTSGILIEVGGKGKKKKPVTHQSALIIASDDIEIGYGNKVPLWLFGFLY